MATVAQKAERSSPESRRIRIPDIAWIEIPAGPFIYQDGETRELPTFWIAKYPITNVQLYWHLKQTAAVGMYPHGRSAYNLDDLSGTVWEWCISKFDKPGEIDAMARVRPVRMPGVGHIQELRRRLDLLPWRRFFL